VSLRNSVVPAALAFAGCLPSESQPPPALEQVTYQTQQEGGDCQVQHVSYQVQGDLYRAGDSELTINKSSTRPGSLLVTVAEDSTVVSCSGDSVRVASPGAELATHSLPVDATTFSFTLPGVIIGGQQSMLWVHALLDANDNGDCDPGELSGSADVAAHELGNIAIELSDQGCPGRG
jgi:hypothetical protein